MKIRMHTQRLSHALAAGLILLLASVAVVLAAGGIDPTDKWAWGTNVGWISFEQASGGVTVYSDHLEGYAWGENIGWIRLGTCTGGSPCSHANDEAGTYGVNNDGVGNLSGYAWGTNVGWINLGPADGGVTIDPVTGDFDGYAWGENMGWIRLQGSSPSYKVTSRWHGDLIAAYENGIAAIITSRRPGPASSEGLIIEDVDFLNDAGDGIIFGHQNGSGTTTADCPPGVSSRWQRVWQLDVNDGEGTSGGLVTLTFDFDAAGIGGPPSGSYALLTRSGTSGEFGWVEASSSISGNQVIFANVEANELGPYITLGSGTPTAVTLVRFEVEPTGDALLITWETAQELDHAGFNLYRSTSPLGPWTQMNEELIPPVDPGSLWGAVYTWLDQDVKVGSTYHYLLEDIDTSGKQTLHGPIGASLHGGAENRVYIPLVMLH